MTFGSLFAGIGGFDLGFERAGMRCEWQVEIDPYCQRVLAKHWPDVRRWDDVRTFPPAGDWGVDVICGGFPCQDISNAGKQAGIEGQQSGLWREFARIIGEIRPRIVVVENVAALLGRGMGRVLGDLSALGFDAEWDVIPAVAVGAPHRRERVWITANANGCEQGRRQQPERGANKRDADTSGDGPQRKLANSNGKHGRTGRARRLTGNHSRNAEQAQRQAMGYAIRSRLEVRQMQEALYEFAATVGASQWATEPNVGRVADGIPARVDRLRGLGNAVVPQVAEWIGRRILEASNQ